jgi:hypothetical protein
MNIKVKRYHGVYLAIAFDEHGEEVDRITALSKSTAKQLLEEKLGIRKARKTASGYKKGPKGSESCFF